VAAACRELREETGYEGAHARIIEGSSQSGHHAQRLLHGSHRELPPDKRVEFDPGEDLATRLVPADEAATLAVEGKIRHSLVIAGLFFFGSGARAIAKRQRHDPPRRRRPATFAIVSALHWRGLFPAPDFVLLLLQFGLERLRSLTLCFQSVDTLQSPPFQRPWRVRL